MEHINNGRTKPTAESNYEPEPSAVPYYEVDSGYIVINGMNYVEVENVLIEPSDNPPL